MSERSEIFVLAVDDNLLVLDAVTSELQDGGYTVLACKSAEEAFELLKARAAELGGLVTDVNLGKGQKTGWDIARRARQLNTDLPVVYVTGDSAHEWAAQGVPHSVLLQKPYASADLVVALAGLRKVD